MAEKMSYSENHVQPFCKEGSMMCLSEIEHIKIFQIWVPQSHWAGDNYHRCWNHTNRGELGKIKLSGFENCVAPLIQSLNLSGHQAPNLNWICWLGPRAPYSRICSLKNVIFKTTLFHGVIRGSFFRDFWCHIADVVWMSSCTKAVKSIKRKREKSDGVEILPSGRYVDFKFKKLEPSRGTPQSPGIGQSRRKSG